MGFGISAACLCHTGYIRSNNEDNFYFRGLSLPEENNGLETPLCWEFDTEKRTALALFDGMGGQAGGQTAAFTAARTLHQLSDKPEKDPILYLTRLTRGLNLGVYRRGGQLHIHGMGATLALLCFLEDRVYSCNLGDSRIYRLSPGKLHRLSEDHTDTQAGWDLYGQARLTQYLGMDPGEFRVEPCITEQALHSGDVYLLCSDGLTDMVTPGQLQTLLEREQDPAVCVRSLVQLALEAGGRDNVTVILCRVL